MPSCTSCSSQTACTTCLANYVSTGTGCLSCVLPNCLTHGYVGSLCACTQCAVGFTLNVGNTC